MPLFWAQVAIEDDPASFSATVLVAAETKKEATKIAKKAAKDSYFDEAGGWAISDQTKIVDFSIKEAQLPESGVVIVSGHYDR